MAGYFMCSLDWPSFLRFLQDPAAPQLLEMAKLVSDALDEYDADFEEDDPVADWPSEPAELTPILRQRLTLHDWYADLSDTGRTIWDLSMQATCTSALEKDFDCRNEGEIYWDVIELARQHHSVPQNAVTDVAISRFGTTPYRYHPILGKQAGFQDWSPTHSMHPPDEVRLLLNDLEAATPTLQQSQSAEVECAFELLMRVLSGVAERDRSLVVQVDT